MGPREWTWVESHASFLENLYKIISAEETFTRSVAYDNNVNIRINASNHNNSGGGDESIKCDLDRYYNLYNYNLI